MRRAGAEPATAAPDTNAAPSAPEPWGVRPAGPLRGETAAPGDKSITHRALIVSALTIGESRIAGPLDAGDTRATATALQALGARIHWSADRELGVRGFGAGGALQPDGPLDLGNSGTGARLIAGVLATSPVDALVTGDASLSRRPMARVADPLAATGARIDLAPGGTLPMRVRGAPAPRPFRHALEVPSAQVKSALLLAALVAPGVSRVVESTPTRDHTERMLLASGADLWREGDEIAVRGQRELRPQAWTVPGDPSAAAFPLLAALLVPGSRVRVGNVLLSPSRAAFLDVFRAMGATIDVQVTGEWLGDPVGAVTARASSLSGVALEGSPALVDEWPVLLVAAAAARGTTLARGLGELRTKESDRIAAMVDGLSALGVRVDVSGDDVAVHGTDGAPFRGGATLRTRRDHRVAMALAVAGLHAEGPVTLDDMAPVRTSYPHFLSDLGRLGAW